ncbi:uncharacterized protein N0V89_007737 [Didymosphaeria variabile]|uniref:TPR-like protein n=1 Tax=Didymosphaeria variabile TaxID=1932322 RepID=A0A9W9C9S0_9PLEO|nr:uncharacterized protein N0V89_007737 [Didymosphaeria variabile]KAJ4352389.1 hypothetical protein N0V89_007737 [Didymosphaeria variabile]
MQTKAQGHRAWTGLMFDVLKMQSTEQEIRDCLDKAPSDIEDMIREVLKMHSSTLNSREAEEFNTILAWVSFAARPLTLAELDAVLRRSSPSGGPVLSLEAKLREKFGSLFTLTRDDGLSTGMLQSRTKRSNEESAYDSKYETTSVGFAHSSIMEYFLKGEGKFAARKTCPKIGVVYAEAQLYILKTCLEVFLTPGQGDKKKLANTLKNYSRDHWYGHLECSIWQNFDATDQIELLSMLYSFLNKPDALRGWCEGTPWTFYTETAVAILWTCMKKWYDSSDLDAGLLDWVETCGSGKAELVFLPAAKVYAEQGLHKDSVGDDWLAQPAITAVAQIRALIEEDDTLDTLPDPPPLETLLKAVRWSGLEENAVWNRKLAVCLRNFQYVEESIPYFERALQLDEACVRARSGLATIYRNQGYFTKDIELESANATYLVRQIKCSNGDNDALNKHLGYSYSLIAYSYGKLNDDAAALRYWRLAAELKAIVQYGIRTYLRLLCASPKENRWKDVIWFSKLMEQAKDDVEDHSRLTTCILENAYPDDNPNGVIRALGRAAVEEGCLEWLVNVYNTAIWHSKDHGTVVYLKMSIVDLHLKFTKDLTRAELLIEEVMEVACLDEEGRIEQLEKCKRRLGQHFCRICVRKAVAAGLDSAEARKYINRLAKLCRSGLEPREQRSKCVYGERSALYLALLQRRSGNIAEAGITVRGWLVETCDLALQPRSSTLGLMGLGRVLIAMGLYDEAISILRVVHSRGKGKMLQSASYA